MGSMTLARFISITPVSILVALAAAIVGFIEVVFIDRLIYPAVRRRHEHKKVTGSHGTNPAIVMHIIKFQGLVALPVLGFLFGEYLFGNYVRGMIN
jgi:hypothetical protein